MELFACYGTDNPETTKVFVDIEFYLIRRMICQLPTRAYNKTFNDLLAVFADGEGSIAKKVHNLLKGFDAESNRWPRDAEFQQSWLERPVYYLLLRQRVRMVLEALERQLFTELTENVEIKTNLTIEHILPQGWGRHWPLPEGDPQQIETLRNRLIHTVGNLTLLTNKNPSVSNSGWDTKKDAILQYSALSLNRQLADFDDWDENTIQSRGQSLFAHVKKIWPGPNE